MITRKFGRMKQYRERMVRNLVTSLVLYEKVRTTEAKAKSVKEVAEHLLTIARTGTLAARREAKALLFDMNAVTKLFEDFPERYGDRTSGFVRLTKLPARPGDAAPMAQLELILTPIDQLLAEKSKTNVKVRKAAKETPETEPEKEPTV